VLMLANLPCIVISKSGRSRARVDSNGTTCRYLLAETRASCVLRVNLPAYLGKINCLDCKKVTRKDDHAVWCVRKSCLA
jgi:hypothetical protein